MVCPPVESTSPFKSVMVVRCGQPACTVVPYSKAAAAAAGLAAKPVGTSTEERMLALRKRREVEDMCNRL